jgi:hypothetical protein
MVAADVGETSFPPGLQPAATMAATSMGRSARRRRDDGWTTIKVGKYRPKSRNGHRIRAVAERVAGSGAIFVPLPSE